MYRRDAEFGKDSSIVTKTASFRMPVMKNRKGEYKMQPDDGLVYTCFTSDFFHPDADEWRRDAWAMMKERSDLTFYFITKRPDRFYASLPDDWGLGWDNIRICCTCEN
jgi:protein gp37